jgi:PAS domain S-box-containing protein
VIVADQTGSIIRVNQAACALFGYDAEEMIDQNVRFLMPAPMASNHDGFMAHHLKTGEKRIIGIGRQVEGLRNDGSVFPLHLSVGRTDADGQPIFVAILHDLTNRMTTERALARSQRLDAIGQMTGGIAHDFNNLLTLIIGNLELLDMQVTSETARDMLTDALEAAELGADLTAQLMAFARQGNLRLEAVDLNNGCETALSILRRTLGSSFRIRTVFNDALPSVMTDPALFQTAIVNLVLNARDAMPDGGDLTIRTEQIEIDDTYIAQEIDVAQGRYVRLSITDTGEGLSTEAQRRAFEPFFTTKKPGKGTGLGLAMVYGFMRQSGGYVTLYSESGLGSTFALYFPVTGDTKKPEQTGYDGGIVSQNQRNLTVLVVEDNAKVRQLSVARIRKLGYQTLEAADGDAAYEIIQSGTPVDLLFTDLVMPGGLNGYELAQKVKVVRPAMKIMLTSGYAEDVLKTNGIDGPLFTVLRKPYRQTTLAENLQAMFADT